MTLTPHAYAPDMADEWDAFVAMSDNGTIFHKRQFLAYHPDGRWLDRSFVFRDKAKIKAVIPAAEVERDGVRMLLSHPGASYGGLVVGRHERLATLDAMLSELEQRAAAESLTRIEMRHSPAAIRSELGQLDFALLHRGYRRTREELATVYMLPDIPFAEGFDDFIASFPSDARRGIRKGAKSLDARVLTTDDELARYHAILTRNLQGKHGTNPVHTLAELQGLHRSFPRDVFVLGVFQGDVLVGGYCLFAVTSAALHVFYAALDYDYQHARPLDFALAKTIHLAHQQGRKVVNYGISTEDGGSVVNHGLQRFKEGFGGTGSVRATWALDL